MRRSRAIVAVVAIGLALLSASYAAKRWLAPAPANLTQPSVESPTESPRSASRDGEQPLPTVEPMVESAPRPRAAPPRGPRSPRFGRVIDAQNGVPISGARVGRPQPAPGGLLDREIYSLQRLDDVIVCDDAGRFESALADGEWLVVAAEGYAAQPVAAAKLGVARDAAGSVQLVRPARLRATVELADGKPAAGVDVRVIDRIGDTRFVLEANTDARGEALVAGVVPGRELQIEIADGFALLAADPVTTEFKSGQGIVKRWKLRSAAIVSGRIVDQHGEPAEEARIEYADRLALDAGTEAALALARASEVSRDRVVWIESSLRTDRDGRFRFECREPGYAIVAVVPRKEGIAEQCHGSAATFVRVGEGARSAWVELDVERGLAIRGRLVGPDGNPIAGRLATVSGDEDWEDWMVTARTTVKTDEEGRFALFGVSSRTVIPLLAWSEDRLLCSGTLIDARVGPDELRIDLAPLRCVVVAERPAAGEEADVDRVRFRRAADGRLATPYMEQVEEPMERRGEEEDELEFERGIPNGELRFIGLVPGRYDVIVEGNDNGIAVVHGFLVEEGGEQRLVVDLVEGALIRMSVPFARALHTASIEIRARLVQQGVVLFDKRLDESGGQHLSWSEGDEYARAEFDAIVLPGEVTVEWIVAGRTTREKLNVAAGKICEVKSPE